MTKAVYTPCAFQPLAISRRSQSIGLSKKSLANERTPGGQTALYTKTATMLTASLIAYSHVEIFCAGLWIGRTKLSGDDMMPITNARLKLRVARVDNSALRSNREKDCMICSCWRETFHKRTSRAEMTAGNTIEVPNKP